MYVMIVFVQLKTELFILEMYSQLFTEIYVYFFTTILAIHGPMSYLARS